MAQAIENLLSESEKNKIRSQYGLEEEKRNYIFEMCISVDGRYLLVRDEVFDLMESKLIGNVWGSIDTFKTIFQNVEVKDPEYQEIKEGINNLPILEGKQNLYELRDLLLEFNLLQDTWFGREVSKAGRGIRDAFTQGIEGLKKFGLAVSTGQWREILTLFSRGVRFVLRKLKDAMYSTVGIIVEAILLVATGGGAKMPYFVIWALIFGLDVYQLVSNDWPGDMKNAPMWAKGLEVGFAILGMITTGAAAKAARILFKPLMRASRGGTPQAVRWVAANPRAKQFLTQILNSIRGVPAKLQNALASLGRLFPKGAEFLRSILGRVSQTLKLVADSIKTLTGGATAAGRGARAGLTSAGVMYGIDKGLGGEEGDQPHGNRQYAQTSSDEFSSLRKHGLSDEEIDYIKKLDNIAIEYHQSRV